MKKKNYDKNQNKMKSLDKKKTKESATGFARKEEFYVAALEFTKEEAEAIERAALKAGYAGGCDYMRDLVDDLANGVMLGDGAVDYNITLAMSEEDACELERRCRKKGFSGIEDGFKALMSGTVSRRELFSGLNVKQSEGSAAPLVGQSGNVFTVHFSGRQIENLTDSAINTGYADVRHFCMAHLRGIVSGTNKNKNNR